MDEPLRWSNSTYKRFIDQLLLLCPDEARREYAITKLEFTARILKKLASSLDVEGSFENFDSVVHIQQFLHQYSKEIIEDLRKKSRDPETLLVAPCESKRCAKVTSIVSTMLKLRQTINLQDFLTKPKQLSLEIVETIATTMTSRAQPDRNLVEEMRLFIQENKLDIKREVIAKLIEPGVEADNNTQITFRNEGQALIIELPSIKANTKISLNINGQTRFQQNLPGPDQPDGINFDELWSMDYQEPVDLSESKEDSAEKDDINDSGMVQSKSLLSSTTNGAKPKITKQVNITPIKMKLRSSMENANRETKEPGKKGSGGKSSIGGNKK